MEYINFFVQPYYISWEYSFPPINFAPVFINDNIWEKYFVPPQLNFTMPIFPPLPTFSYNFFNTDFAYKPQTPIKTEDLEKPKEEKEKDNTAVVDENPSTSEVSENIKIKSDNKKNNFKPKTKSVKIGSLKIKEEEIEPNYYIKRFEGVDIQGLQPCMKDAVIKLNEKAKELGYELVLSSAYRSHEQQKGLKKRKPKLAATPYKSAHEYGVAIDLGLYDKNGKKVSVDKIKEFGEYAESLGLTWGARWKNQYEPWHFNISEWRDLAEVRDEYRRLNNLA